MGNLFWVIIAIVVISTVVGAVAKMLNNLNEMNGANAGARNRPAGGPADGGGAGGARAGGGGGGGVVRQSNTDMDRFLAEIDRLRKKTAEAPPPPANQAPAAPVVQPEKRQDRPRPRVVAESAELPKQDLGFAAPPAPPVVAPRQKPGELPVATVLAPPSTTGAPATRVTRFAGRARPAAKTPFAKNLTSLLATSQGLALAIVLQEVLGPPRCKG
jgi:hypothetical protein